MDRTRLVALLDDPTRFLADPDPGLRRLAASACAPYVADAAVVAALERTLDDPDPRVSAEAAEVLALAGAGVRDALRQHTTTDAAVAAEAIATSLGEVGDQAAVPWLLGAAAGHENQLVREAAVAALGAIGDTRSVGLLLDLARNGPPQVRRRAVVALTAFDGPSVEAAIEAAATDRNPMVREVAVMLLGRPLDDADGSTA